MVELEYKSYFLLFSDVVSTLLEVLEDRTEVQQLISVFSLENLRHYTIYY